MELVVLSEIPKVPMFMVIPQESSDLLVRASERKSLEDKRMETKGIEPSFRRCDRRVLPLHHVPKNVSVGIVPAARRKSSDV
jgi:hypothetical protein